ncbi:zinc finger protein 622 [Belonocnema kinseyi]|uniref:zinc finger protein 622 n=1 Tax=Belonocnema kinseyi TaxID=2817044 RepID=UPI00143D9663|nr:zinc finger protein 622 [Belonocnema kinseyi]
MSIPYTCITCRVAFRDLEVQRQHYKSDWHRYNLKRKVVDLPPVGVEDFQKRVIAQRGKDDQLQRSQNVNCKACRKNFSTQNQYENHLLSKKHKDKSAKVSNASSTEEINDEESASTAPKNETEDEIMETSSAKNSKHDENMDTDSDVESVDSDEWMNGMENPVRNNNCLFCSHHSRTWVRNLRHMTEAHSFFVPDPEYCTDMRGLLVYLGEKVFGGFMCLWCNDKGRAFRSADAARTHMIDKGHCKVLHEGEALAEYADFYDYSTSYPDAENGDPDAEVEIPELDDNDYQLVLPSGNVIGHRSLMIYYKQNLDPNRALAIPKSKKLTKILSMYRALGWTDTQKESAVKKARDIKYMQRVQAKYSTKLQIKANKFQRYFRPQVNF